MKKFGYFIHPIDARELRKFTNPFTAILGIFRKKESRFTIYQIKNLPSKGSQSIEGFFIALPEMFQLSPNRETLIMERVMDAVEAAKKLGADMLGLGGFAGPLCDKGYTAFRRSEIPLTSGSAYTAWSIFEAIYRITKAKNIDLAKQSIAIISATSAIGSLCARKLSSFCAKIILCSSDKAKLPNLQEEIAHLGSAELAVEKNPVNAASAADIAIWIDKNLVDFKALNLTVKTGLVKLPHSLKSGLSLFPTKGIISASLAETILLTLEGKLTNYSFGDNVNPDKMTEIADIAAKYGFEVWLPEAPLF